MKIKTKLVVLEMVSLFILAAILIVMSIWIAVGEFDIRTEETLAIAVEGYSSDVSYLRNNGMDIDITVFQGDTRTESSIAGIEGTKASEEVIETVLNKGENYFHKNVLVNGEKYYGYYKPVDGGMIFAGKPMAGVNQFINTIILLLIGVGLVAYAVSVFVAMLISNSLAKRIVRASNSVKILAEGDLSEELVLSKTKSKDEIDIMGNAVYELQRELKEIVAAIISQADKLNYSNVEFSTKFVNIAESVGNVNVAVEEIAMGSTSQAQETTSAGEQVSNMADVIEQNSKNVKSLEEAVGRMTNLFDNMTEILTDLVQMNEKTSANIEVVSTQTNETNSSAEKIKEAVQMIQNIAEQTNLLSLNASIESARAGEAGRGFAVVAEEIRSLSEDSANNANEIEAIVKELLENSNVSVKKVNEVNHDAQIQKEKLNNTRKAFDDLKTEVSSVASVSQNIYEQTERLEKQKNAINAMVEQLAAISEENAASTQQTSASMHSLSDIIEDCKRETEVLSTLSNDLKEQTTKFKL